MIHFLMAMLCLSLLSCFSSSKKEIERAPAASEIYLSSAFQDFLDKDKFTKEGYDHSNRHFQVGKSLSREQEIRELAGREIWFKSAPNERLHTYYFPQKLNSPIAWNRIFQADQHSQRFNSYGLINDPDCCVPGKDCEAKNIRMSNGNSPTLKDTYGWEFCPNDEALLESLKDPTKKWVDPACDHPILKAADALDAKPREDRCEMAFGNSTGVVGYRKFPNPRFNLARWNKIRGWERYEGRMLESQIDASIEPPFRVGKACASCHASFDPLNPPSDLANPTWRNIKGETGNQYLNISAVMGSGTKQNTIEYQMFVHARPGTVDTSAVPMDFVNNPGTINALINLPQRPVFDEKVSRWVNVDSCETPFCQQITYENGRRNKLWDYQNGKNMKVMHFLKGGEDSVGADLAVQRVYVNIGMCAEQCWVNHLTNLRELDPSQRGFGQTPFDIRQCRQDCASWRANEDRVGDILSYLTSRRPTDLKDSPYKEISNENLPTNFQSRPPQMYKDGLYQGKMDELNKDKPEVSKISALESYLDKRYNGTNLVEKGRQIFAQSCAGCHSSQNSNKNDIRAIEDMSRIDFMKKDFLENGEEIRADWMGNEKSTSVMEVGTYKCRALHSNHMTGRVYQQFSSNDYKMRMATTKDALSKDQGGGRGYYRNISLLNVWAHAPFMHNNSVGPEICGTLADVKPDAKSNAKLKYTCDAKFDPSIEGRLYLFDKSMDELLTPSEKRKPKMAITDLPIRVPLGVSIGLLHGTRPLILEFPKGLSVTEIGSFDLKRFATDMTGALPIFEEWALAAPDQKTLPREKFDLYWISRSDGNEAIGRELAQAAIETFEFFRQTVTDTVLKSVSTVTVGRDPKQIARFNIYKKYYTNCDAAYENMGHEFGKQLEGHQKDALKAFMATL